MSKIVFDFQINTEVTIQAEWSTVRYKTLHGPAEGGIGKICAGLDVVTGYDPRTKKPSYTKVDVWHSLSEAVQEKIEQEVYATGRDQDLEAMGRVD